MPFFKTFNFRKDYIKQLTRAKTCNINRYSIWVNKTLFWTRRQQYWWSQDLPPALVLIDNVFSKSENIKLPCYLPISGNSYKINITWITFWGVRTHLQIFTWLDVCFHGNQEKAVHTVAAWISCFINKLILIRFIAFWMTIIKKELYELPMVELEYFHILS